MNKSHFFAELSSAYSDEIDDLTSDFEGKTVLSARLKEKRQGIDTLLQMIEFAPEMVVPIFHGAFTFTQTALMSHAVQAEPDDDDFPEWASLLPAIRLADWAEPLVLQTLAEPAGDRFMVSAAGVEFLRTRDSASPASPNEANESGEAKEKESDDEDGDQDLAEAGADWLSQQGFDARGD